MSSRDNIERWIKSLDDLREKNKTIPIIVEGLNDKRALLKLGMQGKIIKLHSQNTIDDFCKKISLEHAEVILLLDWDSKGKKLTSALIKNLAVYGVRVNFDFWKLCFSVVSQLSTVESLPSVFYRLVSDRETSLHI
jgi:5S rRNA maturation endonuclease (ribonuclease M5)